ncbi:MATE family efflux transporter [soil metagenome]
MGGEHERGRSFEASGARTLLSHPPRLSDAPEPDETRRQTRRVVVALGTPIILANLLAWSVSFADVLMVSRLGEAALAGLGMATQVFFLVVIFILAVTTGTMALVARFMGAGDPAAASHVFRQSLLLAVAQSLVMSIVGIAVAPLLMQLLGATPDVAAAGTIYLQVLFAGIAAVTLDFTIASTFRGAGDSMTPLRITGYVVVLNIVGNYLLIFGPGPLPALGVAGAAASTVISRTVGAWLGWRRLREGDGGWHFVAGSWRPDWEMMRRVLRIGIPSAVEGFMRAGSSVAFLGIIARTGPGSAAVAAHTVGLQLESFSRMPSFGISVAATSLVGQRLGAGNPDGAERAGWASLQMGVWLICVLAVLLFVAARPVSSLFTNDPATLALSVRYLRILAVAQPLFMVAVVLTGALRGGGDTRFPMWVSFLSGWVFLLPISYWLAVGLGWGPEAAWLAQAGNYALSALLVTLRFRGGRWRSMKV